MGSAVPIICNACGQEIDPTSGVISINGLRGVYHESCVTQKNVTPMAIRIAELEAALRQIAGDGPGCEFENMTGYTCRAGAKVGEAWCPRCIAMHAIGEKQPAR